MSEESKIELALARFESAISSVEVAVMKAQQSNHSHETLGQEVVALRDDRSRLAAELDEVKAAMRAQEEVNAQISARVDGVMHNIRTILGGAS
ncbi:MAG: DUF4164 family protein [Hyphomicrobiales bacterium]